MSPSSLSLSVGIIGGGIGGLTTANALLRKGFTNVKVFDAAAKFLPTSGAGFGFSPNGQICLSSLGIQGYQEVVHPFHNLVRMNREGQVRQESNVLKRMSDKHGFGIAGCLRADLIDLLKEPLVVNNNNSNSNNNDSVLKYSHRLSHIEQDTEKVSVQFENGLEETFDLVLGADGINSTVAEQLNIDHSPPIYSGANIFYGVIPTTTTNSNHPDGLVYKDFQNPLLKRRNCVIQGPGTGEVIFFRVGPEEREHLVWAVTYRSPAPPPKSTEWQPHQGDTNSDQQQQEQMQRDALQMVLDQYPASHPIHEASAMTHADRLLHFGLFYRNHKRIWSKGRVCLMGDACHAVLPYAGQGANQAIEDAIVMANCLSNQFGPTEPQLKIEHAFQEFYKQRSKRTQRVVNLANFMDKLYHSENRLVHIFLDFFLTQFLRGGFIFKQIEKELIEECPIQDWDHYRPFRKMKLKVSCEAKNQ